LANAVCVNSGTAALELALMALGIEHAEVILPAQTFVATAVAILRTNNRPIFADIDPRTGNLSVASVEEKMTNDTRAIIGVHWAGMPCDMAELNHLALRRNLRLIFDAAHALGATYRDRSVGAAHYQDAACFSFQAIKHLTTGDGGAVSGISDDVVGRARRLRWFGISKQSPVGALGEREYELLEYGDKFHMNDVAAAIGLGNLVGLEDRLERRHAIARAYRNSLSELCLLEKPDRKSADWLFPILVERRSDFVRAMKERKVPVSVVHQRIDRRLGWLRELPGQAEFDAKQIHLPIHQNLTDADVAQVIEAVRLGW
jgi:perosamine synthetase